VARGGTALLIEADDAYRASMSACIRLAGCNVETVAAPAQALEELGRRRFDLVVWGADARDADRRMQMLSELRLLTESPLVLIAEGFETARTDLESGADQRLPKPFIPGALVGAIHAALRKSTSAFVPPSAHVESHGMVLDGDTRSLTYATRHVDFTRREWDLLLILFGHVNRYVGAHDILSLGWKTGEHGPEQVRIYVRRLRRKLEPMDLPCRLISQHGKGYSLTLA
jgi:two-component system KDP operon response regulator KdpE